MTLTNQLDWAHRSRLTPAFGCVKGEAMSLVGTEWGRSEWSVGMQGCPQEANFGWCFEGSQEKTWVPIHKACHLNKTRGTWRAQGCGFSSLYISQSPLLHRCSIAQELWMTGFGRHFAKWMKGWPSTLPLRGRSTEQKQMSQAPVDLSLLSSIVHSLLSSFSLQHCAQESLRPRRSAYPVTLWAAFLKGRPVECHWKFRLSCDHEVSGGNGWLNC